jgi:hypothetical protein
MVPMIVYYFFVPSKKLVAAKPAIIVIAGNLEPSGGEDELLQMLQFGSNTFRFVGIGAVRTSSRNKPPERPEVLSKPAAKPKYSFLRDYNKLYVFASFVLTKIIKYQS